MYFLFQVFIIFSGYSLPQKYPEKCRIVFSFLFNYILRKNNARKRLLIVVFRYYIYNSMMSFCTKACFKQKIEIQS